MGFRFRRSVKLSLVLMIAGALAWTTPGPARAQSFVDLSKPMSGPSRFVVDFETGERVVMGEQRQADERELREREGGLAATGGDVHRGAIVGSGSTGPAGCGGREYGAVSCATGRQKTVHVKEHVRKDGRLVSSYNRSPVRSGGRSRR